MIPLERALSKLGLATRSEARAMISDGRVTVDGRVVRDPTRLVIPERTSPSRGNAYVDQRASQSRCTNHAAS